MLPPDARLTLSPDVAFRVLEGEAVLLDLEAGKYYSMTDVATRAWEMFSEGKTVGEVREALLTEYEVEPDVLDADLDELYTDLLARGLLRRA